MGANGKGNGKNAGARPAEPVRTEGGAANGKSKDVAAEVESVEALPKAAGPAQEAAPPEVPPEETAATPPGPPSKKPAGAAWGRPLSRFEERWTWLESRLLTFVLVWQIVSLVAWVFLNGLSESVTTSAGTVFRALALAIAAGAGAYSATSKRPEDQRRNLTLLAIALGLGLMIFWHRAAAGAAEQKITSSAALRFDKATSGYFDNIKGWLQEGSTLTLLGGLRGLGTRLTLWLALLGGSLATASGKHIHVDVIFRFLPRRARVPVTLMNYGAAALVCFAGAWGFFDHIAIESYGTGADQRPAAKLAHAAHHIGDQAFLTRKQVGLDLRSLPHVLAGERYDSWMSAAAWNEWVDGAGFESRWPADKVKTLRIPADSGSHPPFVVSPGGENPRGALAHTLGLVFPFGLLAIGLRFLLRALLMLSGHVVVDPDEAHKEEIGAHAAGSV